MGFTDACIRRPVMAWMLMLAVVLVGGVSLSKIGISQFPDVDFPTVSISVAWPGASAEAVENDVVQVIEDGLAQVEGIKSLSATVRPGAGTVNVEFNLDRSIDAGVQEVQARLGQITRLLPKDLDPPVVGKVNPEDFPIMFASVAGNLPRRELTDLGRSIRDRLQRVNGVGDIFLGGYVERAMRIWLDPARLAEYNLTASEVVTAVTRQHKEVPAGKLEPSGRGGRELDVRLLGEATSAADLGALVVGGSATSPIHLSQVALVEDGYEDVTSFARVNGQPALAMGIRKQHGVNQIEVAKAVRTEIAAIGKTMPPGTSLGINYDASIFVEHSITHLEYELALAVVLTGLVCWLFLGSWSAAVNVLLAIPMSLLGTIAVLYACGFTLNTFTLLGLALVIGLVVDDAIMVQENISRHRELGLSAPDAARKGTHEIAFAALAATAAVVAIFAPVLFMSGVIGKFFLQFGVALSVAILLSYVEAVTLAPARCGQFLAVGGEHRSLVGRWAEAAFAALGRAYGWVLDLGLKHPVLTLLALVLVFVGSLFLAKQLPGEFVPTEDQGRLFVKLDTQGSSNLLATDDQMRRLEAWLIARGDIERTFAMSGGFGGQGSSTGTLFLALKPRGQRKLSQQEIQAEIREETKSWPGVKIVVQDPSAQAFTGSRGGGYQVEFSLRGDDWAGLQTASRNVQDRLLASGAAADVDNDARLGRAELAVTIDRAAAADLGVAADDIATTVNFLLGGNRIAKYADNGRRFDIRVRSLADQRGRADDLAQYRVRAKAGALIPLSELVTVKERPAIQAIQRRDRSRSITVYANLAKGKTLQDAQEVITAFAGELPATVRLVQEGASKQMKESFGSLKIAFILGIATAYLVLGAQFNSFLHPITVLTVMPLAFSGALISLWLGGFTINVFSVIGILLLMGISKKNSIILVDYANQLRETGLSAAEAMRQAGPIRLRPILMTSAATFMAAVPTAIGLGSGSESRQPMAVAILGGVAVSTALSLILVPAFYLLADRVTHKILTISGKWFRRS